MRTFLALSITALALSTPALAGEATWGKLPLSAWKKQLQDASVEARHGAATEFIFMDLPMTKEAIPELTQALKDSDARVRFCVARSLGRCGADAASAVPQLIAALEVAEESVEGKRARGRVVEALGNIGSRPKDVVPALIRQLGIDAEIDRATAEALGKMGSEAKAAIADLKKLIRPGASAEVLSHAGVTIASLEPDAPEVAQAIRLLAPLDRFAKCTTPPPYLTVEFLVKVPDVTIKHVVPLLKDDDKQVRRNAARVLAAAGARAKNAASAALVKALSDSDDDVRAATVTALSSVDPEGFAPAVPVLVQLLGARKFRASEGAVLLRPYNHEAFPLLIRELDRQGVQEDLDAAQGELVYALSFLWPRWDKQGPLAGMASEMNRGQSLLAALRDPSVRIRRGVAKVLRQIGPAAQHVGPAGVSAVPALLELTKDKDAGARLDAIEALFSLDPENQSWAKWLPTLEPIIRDKDSTAQTRALMRIRWMGAEAKTLAPTLLIAAADEANPTRTLAAITLVRVDRTAGIKALPTLMKALQERDSPWLGDVVEAVGALGPPAKEALPALRSRLALVKQNAERVRLVAALTRIDRHEIAACRGTIEEILKKTGRNWRTGSEPILLLVEWGREALPLVPVLRESVTADRVDPRTQLAAALCLVLIGGDQDAAGMKLIRDVVRTPDESYLRQQLLDFVGRLGPLAKPLLPEVRPLLSDADFGTLAKATLAKVEETED